MQQWFNRLTLSERQTIIIGIIVVMSASIYFLLWEPFVANHKQLKNIVAVQKNNLAWMRTAANEVRQLRNTSTPQNLLSLVDTSIRELNTTDKRIKPKGEQEVLVDFPSISFTKLIEWLAKLYNQHQIQVSTISIERQANSDQVIVKLTLQ